MVQLTWEVQKAETQKNFTNNVCLCRHQYLHANWVTAHAKGHLQALTV